MYTLKIRKIGGSLGAIFSADLLKELQAEEGDTVCVLKDEEGHMQLKSHNTKFQEEMEIFEKICKRYKNTLRELAKK